MKTGEHKHRLLASWAADCAVHVLTVFEKDHPQDARPRQAIEAACTWVSGKMKISEARKFAFTAHAAASDAGSKEGKDAARAAGHAAATAHVAGHA